LILCLFVIDQHFLQVLSQERLASGDRYYRESSSYIFFVVEARIPQVGFEKLRDFRFPRYLGEEK